MKYLMGLILSFTLGAAAIAQDTKNDNCDDATTSKESEVIYGDSEQDFTKMERVDENGSVYYYDNPSVREESTEAKAPQDTDMNTEADAEIELNQEGTETEIETEIETDNMDAEASAEGSVFTFGNKCSLNGLLDDNTEGKYKFKQELDNGAELKVERERDGDGQVKYESDNEYYTYDKDENGETQYSHGVAKENEAVEILRNKDGSVEVFYQGHFNNVDEARVLENGIKFEDVESVCNQ